MLRIALLELLIDMIALFYFVIAAEILSTIIFCEEGRSVPCQLLLITLSIVGDLIRVESGQTALAMVIVKVH